MFWKFLMLFVFATSVVSLANCQPTRECRIYNDYYKQYLYAPTRILTWFSSPERPACLWREHSLFRRHPSIYYSDDEPKGVWSFEPVIGRDDTFYLRNRYYSNEYLRGSDDFRGIFAPYMNRRVYVQELKSFTDESYMWVFKARPWGNAYEIWNVKHCQPLYAMTKPLSVGKRRKVSLWYSHPNSDRFNWVLMCRGGSSHNFI